MAAGGARPVHRRGLLGASLAPRRTAAAQGTNCNEGCSRGPHATGLWVNTSIVIVHGYINR